MKTIRLSFLFTFLGFFLVNKQLLAQESEVRGLYKTVLAHEEKPFYQLANITLRTVNVGGQMKISANVKLFFGDWNSNEFLTYEYPEVPFNMLTGQINLRTDANDISLVGIYKDGKIEGEWFSTIVGRVGTFKAQKTTPPSVPANYTLVKTFSGYYRGTFKNTNPQSNLPARVTMSFVTTQGTSADGPVIKISGNVRFYLGSFDSQEYVELPFESINFNYFSRYMTARTATDGLTFKGVMGPDGIFEGVVLSDGLGDLGLVEVKRYTSAPPSPSALANPDARIVSK